mmetsp:Transcript_6588/g.11458  ORF Transcript_6588/g.11458 Transcript_6588/m.11458 type:complete len:212 (-) Transcript_6588:7-642(-)
MKSPISMSPLRIRETTFFLSEVGSLRSQAPSWFESITTHFCDAVVAVVGCCCWCCWSGWSPETGGRWVRSCLRAALLTYPPFGTFGVTMKRNSPVTTSPSFAFPAMLLASDASVGFFRNSVVANPSALFTNHVWPHCVSKCLTLTKPTSLEALCTYRNSPETMSPFFSTPSTLVSSCRLDGVLRTIVALCDEFLTIHCNTIAQASRPTLAP